MSKNVLSVERKERIRQAVQHRGAVHLEDLCEELGVSQATVRRDLAVLDRAGLVRRVHGGAVGVGGSMAEPGFEDKTAMAAAEKRRIAQKALAMVEPEMTVFLDGGSTVLALAALLKDMPTLTVATNSMRVAELFADSGPQTIMLGGELRRISQTFVGPLSAPLIEQLHPDLAFFGALGVSANAGMTTTDPREALTKRLALANARKSVLLADGAKVGRVSFVKFGDTGALDALVTDAGASEGELESIARTGARVVVAA